MQSNTSRIPATGFSRHGRQDSSPASSTGSTTPPLKLAKGTTAYALSPTLVGGVKGGAPLARRSSASFNHVRTSSLVSSSPFKTGENPSSSSSAAKAYPQHAQSQSQHVTSRFGQRSGEAAGTAQPHLRSRSDENKLSDHIRAPRQSRGFRDLSLAEAVTKSPFVEAKGPTSASRIPTSRSASLFYDTKNQPASTGMSKSATFPALNTSGVTSSDSASALPRLAPNHTLPSRPLPGAPQKARPVSMSIVMDSPASTSPLTRSNLVSRRLIGPRSPEGSSSNRNSFVDSPTRRERRKTVTWDERCDVVEFEQDDEETRTITSVSDTHEAREFEVETESEQEESISIPQPVTETRDWFGPDREEGRSPSPILSGSINDAMDDTEESSSTVQNMSEDETPTPQREVIDLPVEHLVPNDNSHGAISNPNTSSNALFLGDGNTFHDDSMSTQDDSFHRELKLEPEVETSLKFSETRSPERFPRISRDAIRRQVEQQRLGGGGSDIDLHDHYSRSRTSIHEEADLSGNERSLANASFKQFDYSPAASPGPHPRSEQIFSSSFHGNRSDVNLEDVHSALDRLMLGVEKNFEPSIISDVSDRNDEGLEVEQEEEMADNSFAPQSYGQQSVHYEDDVPEDDDDVVIGDGADLHRQSTAMSGGSTESTDGPETPHMHNIATPDPFAAHQEMDLSYEEEDSKPLPPPPMEAPPSPIQVTEAMSQEQVGSTLAAPTTPTVRRGSTIKRHEEAIKAKRREQRALEGRPSRRRSQSTGDLKAQFQEPDKLELDNEDDVELTDAFQSELAKRNPTNKKTYMMKQRRPTIYASDSRVGHIGAAGDVHGGRAWRAVRRPSDMNEYSKQIRQIRNQEKGASTGKVFVKVLGFRELQVPLPSQPTYFTCVLNNGIHFVETPASRLEEESIIDQEFELIEHEKLEFTLTIKIRKDAHIAQIMNPPPRAFIPPAVRVETPTKSRGVRSFFSSPSKKPSKQPVVREEPTPPLVQTADPFGRYLKKDLSIAQALVSFKDIVDRCNAKLFETSYPLIGQCSSGNDVITKSIGEIVLQIFRLPPLPGISPQDLPQSLDECHRGLRHVQWHKVVYHEGVLTQLGGDCTTWRRRNLRVMGANLIAYNDITKKPITTMDIRKITLVEDEPRPGAAPIIIRPPSEDVDKSLTAPKLRRQRSFNALAGIEHSFRIVFDGNENDEICFFADSAQEKARWLEIFGALVGRIPHNPLWAELLWQRQQAAA